MLTAEEAGPEAATLEDLELSFEPGTFLHEAGLLLDQFDPLLYEPFAFGF